MKNVYCTYFNRGYLCRGIVLIRSLAAVEPDFTIEVLCFDDFTYDFFVGHSFGGVIPVKLADFEARHQELVDIRPTRTVAEYFFTCTSNWILDVLCRHREVDMVTYLDADMKFYSSVKPILDNAIDKDIIICAHHFEDPSRQCDGVRIEEFGLYNVGWVSFRNSAIGHDCLETWASDCRAWCHDYIEGDKFGDQKYLDRWPARYGDRLMIAPKSLNLGPWGIGAGELTGNPSCPQICGDTLLLYHYQGLKLFSRRHYFLGYAYYHSVTDILRILYDPYIRELQSVEQEFGLSTVYGNARFLKSSLPWRLLNGYWLGWPVFSNAIRHVRNVYYFVKDRFLRGLLFFSQERRE